jgi:hypothetical protein
VTYQASTHIVNIEAYCTTLISHTVGSYKVEGTDLESQESHSQLHDTDTCTCTEVSRAQEIHPHTMNLSISKSIYDLTKRYFKLKTLQMSPKDELPKFQNNYR